MEPNSVPFVSIGEAKLSRGDTPQLAAGRVHSCGKPVFIDPETHERPELISGWAPT